MRALVTGAAGFAGKYLRAELERAGYEVVGLSRHPGPKDLAGDLLQPETLLAALETARPELVFHLAGQANVAQSWREPRGTIEANVLGPLNLLEAVRQVSPKAAVLLVGSSDEYGNLGAAGRLVSEETPLRPQTPYAVSKRAQEELGQLYARAYGLDVRMTRSFNHGGAGQKEGYVIADFAAGIARVEKGLQEKLLVGNLSARRDFTHVKDVARAYRLIMEKGRPGEIYNVGSGETHSAAEILERLRAMAGCPIPVEEDPARLRPSDTPVICCDRRKLTEHTGWEPEYGLEEILADTLAYWRTKAGEADDRKAEKA